MIVSVVVVTYNSENFIIETLESIKKQSYKEIELIISDDFSKDNTLKIVEQWKNFNEEHFKKIIVLESQFNQGIAKNLNRGLKKAQGEWIKIIAGDDILHEKCVESNAKHIKKDENIKIVFSKVMKFKEVFNEKNFCGVLPSKKEQINFTKSSSQQFSNLLFRGCTFTAAPTAFIKKELLEKIDYFDENYEIEDYPTWLKITKEGIKLEFLDEITVYYRIHSNSFSSQPNCCFSEKMLKNEMEVYKDYKKGIKGKLNLKIGRQLNYLGKIYTIKKGNKKIKILSRVLFFMSNPIWYIDKITKILISKLGIK